LLKTLLGAAQLLLALVQVLQPSDGGKDKDEEKKQSTTGSEKQTQASGISINPIKR